MHGIPTEPHLTLGELCKAMAKVLGEPVTKTRIKARLKMGMPSHQERGTNRRRYVLSQVIDWWFVRDDGQKSA